MNNPFSGQVPMNRGANREVVAKSTSYRPGESHKVMYRDQYQDKMITPRNAGCEILRRYANGTLDLNHVANLIIDLRHKAADGGFLTEREKAVLALVLPQVFGSLIDAKIAQTVTKLSNDERLMLRILVDGRVREEANWNAGRGGGSIPGRHVTRS